MKVLFDTNVVLDVLLERRTFFAPAATLFSKVEAGEIEGLLGATTVTTVHYLCEKTLGKKGTIKVLGTLLKLFDIAPVNRLVLDGALHSKLPDFEDSVLHEAAIHVGAQVIVTRDPKGFKGAAISIFSPTELTEIL